MNKENIISTLRTAALNHKKWAENALLLISGVSLDKDHVPISCADCAFGEWYYSEGQALRDIPGFKEIEQQHDKLHKKYQEIFVLLFGEVEEHPSFFSKLFGQSKKLAKEKKQQALEKQQQLNLYSEKIIKQLTKLERVIAAMSEEQLKKYTE